MKWQYSVAILIFCFGCDRSKYETLERDELSKGVRYDSLFGGLYLGMDRQDFRTRCFQMNQRGLFTDGVAAKVRYKINELSSPVTLLFFPDFHNERIFQVPVVLQYDAWAPWNANLSSEALVKEAKELFMKWYGGNPFLEIKSKDKPSLWVKIDGNRRITILQEDDSRVKVMFRDLTVKDNEVKQ